MNALERVIAPEIRDDRFSRAIAEVAARPDVRRILEIGSSSGAGSTEAWISGALKQDEPPAVHCFEVSIPRHEALAQRLAPYPFASTHNVSTVDLARFPSSSDVEHFYRTVRSKLRRTPLPVVLEWLRQDVEYLAEHDLSRNGIVELKERLGIEYFDAVLIDGSEFTGEPELDDVYGARVLLLDDTRTFKNWRNVERLEADPHYTRIGGSRWTRNGFAIFERR
jgi:hypothetical protein